MRAQAIAQLDAAEVQNITFLVSIALSQLVLSLLYAPYIHCVKKTLTFLFF